MLAPNLDHKFTKQKNLRRDIATKVCQPGTLTIFSWQWANLQALAVGPSPMHCTQCGRAMGALECGTATGQRPGRRPQPGVSATKNISSASRRSFLPKCSILLVLRARVQYAGLQRRRVFSSLFFFLFFFFSFFFLFFFFFSFLNYFFNLLPLILYPHPPSLFFPFFFD